MAIKKHLTNQSVVRQTLYLVIAVCLLTTLIGPAYDLHAEEYAISLILHEAESVSNDDCAGCDGDDIYWKVIFYNEVGGQLQGGNSKQVCSFENAQHEDQPHLIWGVPPYGAAWGCGAKYDRDVTQPDFLIRIDLELWEEDNWPNPDDQFDIHPAEGRSNVTIYFNPLTHKIRIPELMVWDVPLNDPNAKCALGKIKVPAGQHGDELGRLVFSITAVPSQNRVGIDGDSDNDGLRDNEEICGVDTNGDGVVDIDLPAMGADRYRKDIFVELDWMLEIQAPHDNDHSHAPWLPALINSWHELDRAPVVYPPLPNGVQPSNGIALHVDVGDLYADYHLDFNGDAVNEIVVDPLGNMDLDGKNNPHDGIPDIGNLGALGAGTQGGGNSIIERTANQQMKPAPGTQNYFAPASTFRKIKNANFDSIRRNYFRYALFAHIIDPVELTSGMAECMSRPGCNDFMVTLGGHGQQTIDQNRDGAPDYGAPLLPGPGRLPFQRPVHGTIDDHTGTFLHELGHTLALKHGGADEVNYKPNYLSVMNYTHQSHGVYFDFSNPPDGLADPVGEDLNHDDVLDPSRFMFSASELNRLDETSLDESVGVLHAVNAHINYSCPPPVSRAIGWGLLPIDWNCNHNIDPNPVSVNINRDCEDPTTGEIDYWYPPCRPGTNPKLQKSLSGFDDHLAFRIAGTGFPRDEDGIGKYEKEKNIIESVRVSALPDEAFMANRCQSQLVRVTFEELPVHTFIDSQYASRGVSFLSDSQRTPWIAGVKDRIWAGVPQSTRSSPHSLINRSPNNEPGRTPLVISFESPQRFVGLYLGLIRPGDPKDDHALLKAFDEYGVPMQPEIHCIPLQGVTTFVGVEAIFPDQLIGRIEVSYDLGLAVKQPVHIDDLIFCKKTKPVAVTYPPPPNYDDEKITTTVRSELIVPGPVLSVEPNKFSYSRIPLNGVPISWNGASSTTAPEFTISKPMGTSVTLEAPLLFTNHKFLQWEWGTSSKKITMPRGQNTLSLAWSQEASLTAVYISQNSFPGIGLAMAGTAFEEARFLRALVSAVPWATLTKDLLPEYDRPVAVAHFESHLVYVDARELPYNPDKAKKLLEESGYGLHSAPTIKLLFSREKQMIELVRQIKEAFANFGVVIEPISVNDIEAPQLIKKITTGGGLSIWLRSRLL